MKLTYRIEFERFLNGKNVPASQIKNILPVAIKRLESEAGKREWDEEIQLEDNLGHMKAIIASASYNYIRENIGNPWYASYLKEYKGISIYSS